MTARISGELPRIPGVRYSDHVAFTVGGAALRSIAAA